MKYMKKIIKNIAMWLLKVTHQDFPIIKENIITIKDCERYIAQRMIPPSLQSMFTPQEFEQRVADDVKNELLERLKDNLKIQRYEEPDGVVLRCDILWIQPDLI